MRYCEKIQGYNVKLVEQFALRFNGLVLLVSLRTGFQGW
jgi:hypothetical protein